MPSTYSTNLKIELIGTGEQAGVWGQTTNNNIGLLLEQAISGYEEIEIVDNNTTPTTLTIPDGYVAGSGKARNMYLKLISTGNLSATRNLILPTNSSTAKKLYFVYNATGGTQSVTVKTASGTGVTVPNGLKMLLVCDGTNIVEATSAIYGSGTANYVTKFSATNRSANSIVYDDGTNVGISTASPAYKLDVRGVSVAGNGTVISGLSYTTTKGLVGTVSNHNLGIIVNNVDKITIDTSGNIGLGVTPKAWGTDNGRRAIDAGTTTSFYGGDAAGGAVSNAYYNGTNWIYKTANLATLFQVTPTQFIWSVAATGAAGGTASFTQAMALTSDGRLGIGVALPVYALDISGKVNTTNGILPRIYTTTTQASPWAWNSDTYDQLCITGLSNNLTINADAGTPTNGQKVIFRIKDNGTAKTLTWTTTGSKSFRVIGVTLPTTTIAGKTLYIGCVYNSAEAYWDVLAVSAPA